MDLKTYIDQPNRRRDIATKLGCSPGYLWQLATGWRGRRPSAEFALKIEQATDGEVSRGSLRPDLWPEPARADQQAA
jgi:DNA-binding transcriptional regulator YdaS (Cro superfamily)